MRHGQAGGQTRRLADACACVHGPTTPHHTAHGTVTRLLQGCM